MARYIDADKMMEHVKSLDKNGDGIIKNITINLGDFAADVQEVIRCKDCKYWVHYEGDNKGRCIDGLSINGDDMAYVETNEDDFCSYAEMGVE